MTSVDQPRVLDIMAELAKRVLIDEWHGVCKQAAQEDAADSSKSRKAYLWTGRRGRTHLRFPYILNDIYFTTLDRSGARMRSL